MTSKRNSFEGGTDEVTLTVGNSGGASGDAFDGFGITSPVFDNAQKLRQTMACRFDPTAGNAMWAGWGNFASTADLWARAYYFKAAAPSQTLQLIRFTGSTGLVCGSLNLLTNGKVALSDNAQVIQATSAMTLPTSQWIRFGFFVHGSATVGQLECKIYATDKHALTPDETLTSVATLNTRGVMTQCRIGQNATTAPGTFWVDDIGCDTAGYLGPSVTYVDKDLQLIHAVRSLIAQSRVLQWNVRSLVAVTSQTIWNVRTLVAQASQILWSVRTLVAGDVSLEWDVRGLVGALLATLWGVRSLIGFDIDLEWAVAELIGKAASLEWDVREVVAETLQILWGAESLLRRCNPATEAGVRGACIPVTEASIRRA